MIHRSHAFTDNSSEDFARQLGIANVTIRISDEVRSPCVLGWLRPVVLLPRSLPQDDTNAAIAHELAHVASRDIAWDTFIRVVCGVLWPHPLTWRMVAAHRGACESVSDLVAAELLDDRVTYRTSLARIALALQSASEVSMRGELRASTMPMARRAEIVDRLRIIASDIQVRPVSRRIRSLSLVAVAGFMILGTSSLVFVPSVVDAEAPPIAAEKAVSEVNSPSGSQDFIPKSGTFNVQAVANATGKPLANARVEMMICTTSCRWQTVTADEQGRMTLELPVGAHQYSISGQIYSPGFVPGHFNVDNIIRQAEPMSLVIRMKPGFVASGVVQDESGKPVSGAQVSAMIMTSTQMGYTIFNQTTGDEGSWTMDSVADNTSVSVEHDDFLNTYLRVTDESQALTRLSRGRPIAVLVQDSNDRPVAGARVEFDPNGNGTVHSLVTDAHGRLRKGGLPAEPITLHVTSDRHLPLEYEVPDENNGEEIKLRLSEGQSFEMLIVDPNKRPIPNAFVSVRSTGRYQSLWDGRTDANGVVSWLGATGNVEQFSIGAKGFVSVDRDVDTSQAFEIELRPAPTIRGNVVDSVTGQSINEFSFRLARAANPDSLFRSDAMFTGRDGKFELQLGFPLQNLVVIVEAAGFKTWTQPLDQGTLDESLDIKLAKAIELSGSIVDPSGQPAANASVVLTDPTLMMPLRIRGNDAMHEAAPLRPVEVDSDSNGNFRFSLNSEVPEKYVLFVEHDLGFAHVTFKDLDDKHLIQLTPWTSLEVTANQDGKPVSGLSIQVRYVDYGPNDGQIRPHDLVRVTDQSGRAFFDKVRPWDATLISKSANHSPALSLDDATAKEKRIKLLPTPNQIVLGGTGVRLDAQIMVPPDPQGLRTPEFTESGSIDGTSLSGEPQRFTFKPDATGRFQVDAVPTGHYRVSVPVGVQTPKDHSGSGMWLARLEQSFEVPADAVDSHSVRFEQAWPKAPVAGDDSPPFVGTLARGGQISSRELAGKWVLLVRHPA